VIGQRVVSGSTNTIHFSFLATARCVKAGFPFFFDQFGNANPNAPNGGVEDLFTVSGRSDAGSCSLQQPALMLRSSDNIIFRIPTPTFARDSWQTLTINPTCQP